MLGDRHLGLPTDETGLELCVAHHGLGGGPSWGKGLGIELLLELVAATEQLLQVVLHLLLGTGLLELDEVEHGLFVEVGHLLVDVVRVGFQLLKAGLQVTQLLLVLVVTLERHLH